MSLVTLTVSTSAGQVSSTITGTGSDDPGISFTPGELRFDNVPGAAARRQSILLSNTSDLQITVGTPAVSNTHFSVTGSCAALAPGASCDLTVSYAAGSFLANGTLVIPVTGAPAGAPSTAQYAISLTGLYTSDGGGLQIVPGQHATVNFGAAATGVPALQRVLHVNNLLSQPLTMAAEMPRQFAITASTCATLPANASCDLTVQYTPLTAGDTTGTVFLRGVPADGSTTQTALGYLQGYGTPSAASLAITGDISPSGVLTFRQLASGETSTRTLTVTNPISSVAGTSLTVRRIRSEFPYRSTSSCGAPLAPGQSCAITVIYSPLFQAAGDSGQTATQADSGVLTVESDSATAPQFVDLAGSVTPAFVASPNNSAPIAAITTSSGSLTFTSTAVRTASATQTVTLVNTGTTTVHVGALVTSNGFRANSACATLVMGASCEIAVQYVPQNLAPLLGALEIQSDSSASLDFVSLLGSLLTTQAPAPAQSIAIVPQPLTFGRVLVGKTTSLLATVTNTGPVPVTLGERNISGDRSFMLASSSSSNPCPSTGATLAASASCTIAVSFTPSSMGTLRGTLLFSSSATPEPLTIELSGVGTQPQLTVAPGSISFGDVAVGSTATRAITLINGSTLPVDGLRFNTSAGFDVSSTCGITTLNAGSSCAVNVTYAPTNAGVASGLLSIISTDPASPLSVPVSGNGIVATGVTTPTLIAAPASLNFGSVASGGNATLSFTLANTAAVPASGLLFAATGSFSVTSGCGTVLNPSSTCPVLVTFSPTATRAITGSVTVQNSNSTSPLTIALVGSGTLLPPQLSLTPAALNFGSLPVGANSTLTSTLLNTSNTTVTRIFITTTPGFTVTTGCGISLAPGSSCPVAVSFLPTIAGVQTGLLTVNSSDAALPLSLSLAGTGAVAGTSDGSFTLRTNGGTAASVTVQAGLPASFALLVTPVGGFTGTIALTCSAETQVAYAACSLVPSSVALAGVPQNSIATVSTVSAVSLSPSTPAQARLQAVWCLTPALLLLLLPGKRPAALLILLSGLLVYTSGCGSGGDARIRYVAPGSYSFRVTATSTSGTRISQTVALNITVTPR